MPLPSDILTRIVQAGVQAPSADNGQPWRLRHREDQLRVWHEPSLAILFDTGYRASLIAVGALLENVALTSSALGYAADLDTVPNPADPTLVATVRFAQKALPPDPCFPYISSRTTNRRHYRPRALEAAAQAELRRADVAGAQVEIVEDRRTLARCGRLVMAADRLRYEHQAFHEALFRVIRFAPSDVEGTRDGLDIRTLEVGRSGEMLLRSIRPWRRAARLHAIGLGRLMAFLSYVAVMKSGAVAMVSTNGKEPADALRLGRAMQRFWLTATRLGIAVQPLSLGTLLLLDVPIDRVQSGLKDLSRQLREVFSGYGEGGLAVILRLGIAPGPTTRSLRRPIDLSIVAPP